MAFENITEQSSRYHHLEKMTIYDILTSINKEDKAIPSAVEKSIPVMEELIAASTKTTAAADEIMRRR